MTTPTSPANASRRVLDVTDLTVQFGDNAPVVDGVSFHIDAGETVALVGESGSGKSTTAFSIMGLQGGRLPAKTTGGIRLACKDGSTKDLLQTRTRDLRAVRGSEIAIVFQEPMSSLNPLFRIGTQIVEALRLHRPMGKAQAWERAVDILASLGVPDAGGVVKRYPHELSGGMRQRVMIAMALSCEPRLLIADEPTTALDVTVQAQIIELLKEIQARTGMAILFITHNLGVVAECAHRTMVMYAGRIVETGPVAEVFRAPRMPYTQALLKALPRLDASDEPLYAIPGMLQMSSLSTGCRFHPRCHARLDDVCDVRDPDLEVCAPDHLVACLRWQSLQKDSTI